MNKINSTPKMDNCETCKYNTNDYVCHPHCGGCNGVSKYEPLIVNAIPGLLDTEIEQFNVLAQRVGENVKFTADKAGKALATSFAAVGLKTNDITKEGADR